MIPGVGKAIKDINISDDAFKGIEAIINSMTKEERANPDLIDGFAPQAHRQRRRQRHHRRQQLHEAIRADARADEDDEQDADGQNDAGRVREEMILCD
jgi:hypothetical protein